MKPSGSLQRSEAPLDGDIASPDDSEEEEDDDDDGQPSLVVVVTNGRVGGDALRPWSPAHAPTWPP